MQKMRKILRAVSEKTALQTNQPTNQTNQLLPTTPILSDLVYAGPKNCSEDWDSKFNFKIKYCRLPYLKKCLEHALVGYFATFECEYSKC